MTPLFKKLNLKDLSEVLILNSPPSFESEIRALEGVKVVRSIGLASSVSFALAFATKKSEVDSLAREIASMTEGDAVLWFAYPKGSSKRYKCDFNRDTGWSVLGELGFEGVRQVSIDEDWSALRFRRAEFIKSLKRDPKHAISKRGKARASKS